MRFTREQADAMRGAVIKMEEVYVELREGVMQTRYVVETPDGAWMMKYAGDLTYLHLRLCLRDKEWVRCIKRPVTTLQWVPEDD